MVLVQQGDREAYGALFARYQAPIWGFMTRQTRDPELSSELFQEAFLRVWRSASTYRADQRFKPWIYRVAANLVRDRYRSSLRDVETVEVEVERLGSTFHDDPVSAVDLDRALATLPDNLREAFVLGALHGLDHNEVASALDISPVNARARISRARAALRSALGLDTDGAN